MRSAFSALSLSITTPQAARILSSSPDAIAVTHGAGLTGGVASGSALVAKIVCGSAANSEAIRRTLRIGGEWRDIFAIMRLDLAVTTAEARFLSHGERGGVRGYGLSIAKTPHPDCICDAIRPLPKGEVRLPHLAGDAAVDHELQPGDVFRFVGGQKQRVIGDVPGVAHVAHRH